MVSAAPPLIVHVVQQLAIGGMENGLVNLINEMPSGKFRHAIVCMTRATDFRDRLRVPDVPVIALGKRPGHDPRAYMRLWRELRNLRPALVHTRNFGTLDTQIAALLAGVHVRVHGEHGWDMFDLHGRSARHRRYRQLIMPLVDACIAVSRDIARWLIDSVRVPPRRVRQIYNGVDTVRFSPAEEGTVRPDLPWRESESLTVIGTVGRLEAVKDVGTLLRAFIELCGRNPAATAGLRLLIVGDGSQRGELEKQARLSACGDRIAFLGAREDVPALLRQMDVFVLPSLNEGISNTLLEAMACGLPVIATRVGGNVELIADQETGILVAPGDPDDIGRALATLADDGERRRRVGAAARRRAEREFSLQRMVAEYTALYEGLLGGGRARSAGAGG
jgi:sugar transferase (PEP-CTERM/EpsH1 system associated)